MLLSSGVVYYVSVDNQNNLNTTEHLLQLKESLKNQVSGSTRNQELWKL